MKYLILFLGVVSGGYAQGWTRLSNTAIQADSATNSVCPAENPGGAYLPDANFHSGCHGKIDNWSGGAADTKRNRLIFPATGGHAPSSSIGNESYSLDLVTLSSTVATGCTYQPGHPSTNPCSTNTAAPAMTRLDNPTIYTEAPASCAVGNPADGICRNADGTPWAFHTYGGVVYLPKADKVARYNAADPGRVWLWNATSQTWANSGQTGWQGGDIGAYCALDPTTVNESMICASTDGSASVVVLVRYDTVTNVVTLLHNTYSPHWQDSPEVVFDPDRKLFFAFGNDYAGTPTVNAKLFMVDMLDPTYALQDVTASTSGCDDLLNNGYPGLQWDDTIHKIVGYVPRRQTTSSTSVTLPASGTITITVPTGLNISAGSRFSLNEAASFQNNIVQGTVTSYNSGTGSLVLAVSHTEGTAGSYTDWIVAYAFNAIVVFDPGNMTCVVNPQSTGDPAISPTPDWATLYSGLGTNGKFSYFPKYPGGARYVVVAAFDNDAWTFQLNATPTNGLGASTLTCVDRDGDGYGTGPTALGPYNDLVIDGSNNKLVSSASYSFVAADVGRVVTITSGAGFTVSFNNAIMSVSAGKATLLFAAGTVSSTGGAWRISGCVGPDADDQDAGVHTAAQALAKWGTVQGYLRHEGYDPARVWYVSPSGNDGTGAVTNPPFTYATPFATCCGSGKANPVAGDAVIFRDGDYSFYVIPPTGTVGHPILFMDYPGERSRFTGSAGANFSGTNPGDIKYIIVDGMRVTSSSRDVGFDFGNNTYFQIRHSESVGNKWGISAANFFDAVAEDNVMHDNISEGATAQHGIYWGGHQWGSPYSTNSFIRRNLLYNNNYNGMQLNGTISNAIVEQNIAYGNAVGGFSFLSGVKNSFLRSNLAFDNAQVGFQIFNYPDLVSTYVPTGIGRTAPFDQSGNIIENNTFYHSGTDPTTGAAQTSSPSIGVTNVPNYVLASGSNTIASTGTLSFTVQTWSSGTTYVGNDIVLFSGNLYVVDGNVGSTLNQQPDTNPDTWHVVGVASTALWANGNRIRVCPNLSNFQPCLSTNATNWMEGIVQTYSSNVLSITMDVKQGSGTFSNWVVNLNKIGDLGNNAFRNNIMVMYSAGGAGSGFPSFRYDDEVYPSTSTYTNNVFYSLYPTAGTYANVIQTVGAGGVITYYTCSTATAGSGMTFGSFSGCQNADPKFVAASPNSWNSPSSFDLRLLSSSPGVATGSPSQVGSFDLIGTGVSPDAPYLGAYEGAATGGSSFGGKVAFGGKVTIQ